MVSEFILLDFFTLSIPFAALIYLILYGGLRLITRNLGWIYLYLLPHSPTCRWKSSRNTAVYTCSCCDVVVGENVQLSIPLTLVSINVRKRVSCIYVKCVCYAARTLIYIFFTISYD